MPAPTKNIPDTTRNNTNYSTDLTDAQWEVIAAALPPPDTSGRPPKTNLRHAINAMFDRLKTGCQWAMLPRDFGIPPRTVLFWFAKLFGGILHPFYDLCQSFGMNRDYRKLVTVFRIIPTLDTDVPTIATINRKTRLLLDLPHQ